jgi:hypothetical protein
MTALYEYVDEASGRASKLIADNVYQIIKKNAVSPFGFPSILIF